MNKKTDTNRPLILALETATRAGGVVVTNGNEVLSRRVGDATISHSSNLIELIESALQEAGAQLSDIDFFAAAIGPGSFTGLRIGLATIKGFAACTGRRVAPISTLAAIAHAAGPAENTVAVLPAGRGEVFAQMFSVGAGEVTPLDKAAHLSPEEFRKKYGAAPPVSWAGEGERLIEVLALGGDPSPQGGTANSAGQTPECLAISVAALALSIFRGGKLVAAGELQADYVRASDAEINDRWQQQKAQEPV